MVARGEREMADGGFSLRELRAMRLRELRSTS